MAAQPTTRRRRADDALFAAPAPGWVPREDIVRLMEALVPPGQAHRVADHHRAATAKSQHYAFTPHTDHALAVAVGSRELATRTLSNAVKGGVWITTEVDGVQMVRHRDWAEPVEPGPVFTIPTVEELEGLARLLKATDWEKAAIVAAFVTLGAGKGKSVGNGEFTISPQGFADYGIAGLTGAQAVRRYVKAWESTGLPRPTPGERVTLPDQPFPTITGEPRRRARSSRITADTPDHTIEAVINTHDDDQVVHIVAELQAHLMARIDADRPPLRAVH